MVSNIGHALDIVEAHAEAANMSSHPSWAPDVSKVMVMTNEGVHTDGP